MRVLLTGASGQLGAYLAEVITESGHDLTAWSGAIEGHVAGVPLVPIDLGDADATSRALDRADPESVRAIPNGLAARVSLLYGPSRCGRESYFDRSLDALRRGESLAFFEDEFRTPLDLGTAARILLRLAESKVTGLIHVGGPERLSRFELMRRAAMALGLDAGLIRPNRQADVPLAEPRPSDVSLDCSRLVGLWPDLRRPTVEEALEG
jgi:dTDP-4-dehydrorhamnose reductase